MAFDRSSVGRLGFHCLSILHAGHDERASIEVFGVSLEASIPYLDTEARCGGGARDRVALGRASGRRPGRVDVDASASKLEQLHQHFATEEVSDDSAMTCEKTLVKR